MEEKDMRICPVCGKEVERNDMNFTVRLTLFVENMAEPFAKSTIISSLMLHKRSKSTMSGAITPYTFQTIAHILRANH